MKEPQPIDARKGGDVSNGESFGICVSRDCLRGIRGYSVNRRISPCRSADGTDIWRCGVQRDWLWIDGNHKSRQSIRHYRNNILAASASNSFNSWCCHHNRAAHGSLHGGQEVDDLNGEPTRICISGDCLCGLCGHSVNRRSCAILGSGWAVHHCGGTDLHCGTRPSRTGELHHCGIERNQIWADWNNQPFIAGRDDWNHFGGRDHHRPPDGCVHDAQGIDHYWGESPTPFSFFIPLEVAM